MTTTIKLNKPLIMGILNVTPDSFSDGGQFNNVDAALKHAIQMINDGATIIDVGGESTRPGAKPIKTKEQVKRTAPVIEAIADYINNNKFPHLEQTPIISIDTTCSCTAAGALKAGAKMVNDVSAATRNPKILKHTLKYNVPICLMHMQGSPQTMQNKPAYNNILDEVFTYLTTQAKIAQDAGIPKNNIILDPGIGFGKTPEHNITLLNNLDKLRDLGYPTLLGTSRKSILKHCFQNLNIDNPTTEQLDQATATTTTLGSIQNINIFRVHNVALNKLALDITQQLK